jgi:hypothetical protein
MRTPMRWIRVAIGAGASAGFLLGLVAGFLVGHAGPLP